MSRLFEVIMEEKTLQRNLLSIVQRKGFLISLKILTVLNKMEFLKDYIVKSSKQQDQRFIIPNRQCNFGQM